MKKLYLLMMMTFLVAVSCTKDETKGPDATPVTIEKENYTFMKNTGLYNAAGKDRSEDYSSPFEITKIEKAGDILNITVSFSSGCETNRFEIIWDGTIMESYPPQTRIFVKRNASGCSGPDEIETTVLTVDLNELIFEDNDPQLKDAVIIVSNASKKTGTQNADLATSDKD